MNCKENTGLLFRHPCKNEASARCAKCGKPICPTHTRTLDNAVYCISCLKSVLKNDPSRRQRFASTYRDDPFFYWYLTDPTWDDDYDASDYGLFDQGNQNSGSGGFENSGWEGS